MNKLNYVLILSLVIFSCSSRKDIEKFNKTLGEENVETLDCLVKSFESNYLKIVYPEKGLDDAYESFLNSVLENKVDYDKVYSRLEDSKKMFEKSRLKYEIYRVVDSVWIIDSLDSWGRVTLKMRYKFIDSIDQYNYSYDKIDLNVQGKSLDSIIYMYRNTVGSNYHGKYLKAIEKISNGSSFFRNLNEIIEATGASDYLLTSDLMIRHNVDFDDYFIKRLVLTEIIY